MDTDTQKVIDNITNIAFSKKKFGAIIQNESERLEKILSNVMDFTKPSSEEFPEGGDEKAKARNTRRRAAMPRRRTTTSARSGAIRVSPGPARGSSVPARRRSSGTAGS